jgi:hypothetical protein
VSGARVMRNSRAGERNDAWQASSGSFICTAVGRKTEFSNNQES